MKFPKRGYLVVASKKPNFYLYAINLIESIKEYYPDAHVTLVADEVFLDGREDAADHVIVTEGDAVGHYRAKIWGMTQTPYEQTMYCDADMGCEHEDIENVFDDLKGKDLVFHELAKKRETYYAIKYFTDAGRQVEYRWCGGVCLYKSANPLVMDFMRDWWDYYKRQWAGEWRPPLEPWNDLKAFDQTSLWWLLNKVDKYEDIKVGTFEDDIRWNYFTQYQYENLQPESGKPIVLRHYSGCLKKDDAIVG